MVLSILIGVISGILIGRTIIDILFFDVPMMQKGRDTCFKSDPSAGIAFSLFMWIAITVIIGYLNHLFLNLTAFSISYLSGIILPIPQHLSKEQKFSNFILKHINNLDPAIAFGAIFEGNKLINYEDIKCIYDTMSKF